MWIINAVRGFCMALADSVPGVSGGTIAFLLGFYDKFVFSLDALITGTKKEKREAVQFLIKLGIGWVIGFILAVLVLANLFQTHIYAISSLFIGFILFAIPLVVREESELLKKKPMNCIYVLIGIIFVVVIVSINPVAGDTDTFNMANLSITNIFYVFVTAMIAISAMILPGISGSTLLLIFGLYVPVITAIKDILHFQFDALPLIIVFGLGILAGIFLFIRLIRYTLLHYRSQMIYFIIGLMLGSIYAVINGPATLDIPQNPMTLATFEVVFFLIGGIIILGIQKLKAVLGN